MTMSGTCIKYSTLEIQRVTYRCFEMEDNSVRAMNRERL